MMYIIIVIAIDRRPANARPSNLRLRYLSIADYAHYLCLSLCYIYIYIVISYYLCHTIYVYRWNSVVGCRVGYRRLSSQRRGRSGSIMLAGSPVSRSFPVTITMTILLLLLLLLLLILLTIIILTLYSIV